MFIWFYHFMRSQSIYLLFLNMVLKHPYIYGYFIYLYIIFQRSFCPIQSNKKERKVLLHCIGQFAMMYDFVMVYCLFYYSLCTIYIISLFKNTYKNN